MSNDKNGSETRTVNEFHYEGGNVVATTAVVKETVFDRGMDIDYLIGLLRNQRKTGTLRIDISQGGVCSIRLEERQKL